MEKQTAQVVTILEDRAVIRFDNDTRKVIYLEDLEAYMLDYPVASMHELVELGQEVGHTFIGMARD